VESGFRSTAAGWPNDRTGNRSTHPPKHVGVIPPDDVMTPAVIVDHLVANS
jgi:hypothetical protein